MKMKTILRKHCSNIALVVGNGINLYGAASKTNSWYDLLVKLAKKNLPSSLRRVPNGIALTEFYDMLDLKSNNSKPTKPLQQQFCDLMSSWKPYGQHQRIVDWAKKNNSPILTTNFEQAFSKAGSCSLRRTRKGGFTDYYPWESYYSSKDISDLSNEFGIWHINGMEHYHRSIRLGLSHYMGSVERARGWLHKGNERRLFSGKNINGWDGADTWLHVIFNTPLLIFGLGLEENEVFLRWLLIERARYFKKFPERKKNAWYVSTGESDSDGKKFFLDGVGIEYLKVNNYGEIYNDETWS